MEKPVTLRIRELRKNLNKVINESELALFLIEPIFREFLGEIHFAVEEQTNSDEAEYNNYIMSQSAAEHGECDPSSI